MLLLLLSGPKKSLRCLHASPSQQQQYPLSWVCKAAALGLSQCSARLWPLLGMRICVLDRVRFLPIKKMDQRTCIKFCVEKEIKCADAFRMLTVAYREATLDRSNVYRWYKMFSEGREDVNDEERARRPSTSTTDEKINEVEKMILANRRITVREVVEDLNISIGSCHSIFINDLGMRRVAAKFVPKLLNCDQKQHRMNIANEMLDSVRDDPNLLQRVITGDEAWVYGYDVETKAQSSQWKLPHEPRPKKARQVRSNAGAWCIISSCHKDMVNNNNEQDRDDTSTTVILAHVIGMEGLEKILKCEINMKMRRDVMNVPERVVEYLKTLSKPGTTSEKIAELATISANDIIR
ncbi:hypothetical protein LAZ67_19001235 [Cordylochernes scorpioides]|uniref:Mos1 transposase HTH domain-containing protein n=1 Tax=Cordylochernes scorpioides TaxID=51811 RepID=A0ABY6LHI9_9ARAC|nr:hypothetical protein LAZ67_19001235 [Cordylochernes scorpioides]